MRHLKNMIVKVQIQVPLQGGELNPPVFIQSKDRSVIAYVNCSGPLLARMRGRPLAYFHADRASGSLEIGDDAPVQEW